MSRPPRNRPQQKSRQKSRHRHQATPSVTPVEVVIERLGALGDGIAAHPSTPRPVYVPLALPGERVRVVLDGTRGDGLLGRLEAVLDSPNPDRQTPPCLHFGTCGGCTLQHMADAAYQRLKLARVSALLARLGGAAELRPLLVSPPGSRRRAVFSVRRLGAAARGADAVVLGFNALAAARVIALETCPVLVPAIVRALPDLRAWLAHLLPPGATADLHVTACDNGLDLVLRPGGPSDLSLTLPMREALADAPADIARISWLTPGQEARGAEPVLTRAQPLVTMGATAADAVSVALPPGGFLQATAPGQAALQAAVSEAVGPLAGKVIADLHAGCGTFALPLARHAKQVLAVEGDGPALAALTAAANRAQVPVRAEQRDLVRRPLLPAELARLDAVVMDPPRAGAREQAETLARSQVPVIASVSCNPDSFARDAALLIAGGYRLDWVQPVDQFLWSPHLELVGRFVRD